MRSLYLKLLLAFLTVSLVGMALITLLARRGTREEFDSFLHTRFQEDVVARLAEYYRGHRSWEGLSSQDLTYYLRGRFPEPTPGDRPLSIAVQDETGRVVLAGLGYQVGDQVPFAKTYPAVPIVVDGQRVGWLLGPRQLVRNMDPAERRFVERFDRVLLWSIGGAVLAAALLAVLLSRTLTQPIRELTHATAALAKGELGHQVPVRSRDELGELVEAFNKMSAELARAQKLRRQMTADIAHELRTPLSLVLGYAEALDDGTLPPSPETFRLIADEAQRLTRLVGDLRILSLSDAGELPLHRRPVSPAELLDRAATAHRWRAQANAIDLFIEARPDLPQVYADPDRLDQVLDNLLSNALRHTPQGGHITLTARHTGEQVSITVRDSGPGIAAEDLPYVFERFYRADKARQREQGGTGLGLAIARSLVEAHGGHIWVKSVPGDGAAFSFTLPLYQDTPPANHANGSQIQ